MACRGGPLDSSGRKGLERVALEDPRFERLWLEGVDIEFAWRGGGIVRSARIVAAGSHIHLAVGHCRHREFDCKARIIGTVRGTVPQGRQSARSGVGI